MTDECPVALHVDVDLESIPEPTAHAGDPLDYLEGTAMAGALRRGIRDSLTAHQQRVLIAIAVEGIPIDVIADRLGSNRNAVYKTLHDARQRLRTNLIEQGYLQPITAEEVK